MLRKSAWMSLALVCAFTWMATTARADTLEVPGTYATIQDAVDAASDGDVISIAPGVYDETVDVPVAVTIRGAGSGTDPLADTIIDPSGAGFALHLHRPVGLEDLRVTGASSDGIRVELSAPATVLVFENVTWSNVVSSGNGGKGVEFHNGTQIVDMLVENCGFDDNASQGVRSASNVTFDGFRMDGCSANGNTYGLYLQGTLDDVTLVDCEFSDCVGGYGIYTSETGPVTDFTVDGCTFHDNVVGMMIWNVQDNAGITVRDSSFQGNDRWGALIWGNTLTDVLVEGCLVLENDASLLGYYGLDFRTYGGPLDNVAVHGCAIADQGLGNGLKNRGWHDGTDLIDQGWVDASCNWWGDASGPGEAGPGTGDGVTAGVGFTPWFVTSDLGGACLGGTLQGTKTMVAAALADLLPTANAKDDKRIADAIDEIEASLDPDYWTSPDELADSGKKVFDREKNAVVDLGKVADTDVSAAIAALVAVDRALAENALATAILAGGDAKNIGKAQGALAKGIDHAAEGKASKAVGDFKKAWSYARKALP